MAATRVILSYPWQDRAKEEGYICSLTDDILTVARKELREEESGRQQALQQIKDWIRKNQDLANCRTDSNFLLRFLRVKKFSVPMAENMLLKYLNLRQTLSHLFMKLDYLQPSVLQLIDNGYLFPSPIRDKYGRKVVIGIAGKFDPHKYTCEDMARVHMVTYETLLEDEENQVVGFTHFGDLKSLSMSHVSLWSPTEFATAFKWGEQSIPMRHKEVHLMNVPGPLRYVYDFTRSRLSQKIRDRFTMHSSLAELHSNLDPKVLPKEYGGTIPMADMIDIWKRDLLTKRLRVVGLDKMELVDNKCLMKNDRNNNEKTNVGLGGIAGSFRRLEFD